MDTDDLITKHAITLRELGNLGINNKQDVINLLADRDEWKQQHENILSVRQSDLQVVESLRVQLSAMQPSGCQMNYGKKNMQKKL